MKEPKGGQGRAPLDERESKALAEWMRAEGDAVVLAATGLSRQGLYRAAAGLSVIHGTRLAARTALATQGAS